MSWGFEIGRVYNRRKDIRSPSLLRSIGDHTDFVRIIVFALCAASL